MMHRMMMCLVIVAGAWTTTNCFAYTKVCFVVWKTWTSCKCGATLFFYNNKKTHGEWYWECWPLMNVCVATYHVQVWFTRKFHQLTKKIIERSWGEFLIRPALAWVVLKVSKEKINDKCYNYFKTIATFCFQCALIYGVLVSLLNLFQPGTRFIISWGSMTPPLIAKFH